MARGLFLVSTCTALWLGQRGEDLPDQPKSSETHIAEESKMTFDTPSKIKKLAKYLDVKQNSIEEPPQNKNKQ